jgi:mRNA-degrading endonuclease toxin of MazEF toxin-antitoxin module
MTDERGRGSAGNVPLVVGTAGLDRDCTVNVSQLMSVSAPTWRGR